MENIKNIDQALFDLMMSNELWIFIGAVVFLVILIYVKKLIDARSARMFGKQRFLAQSDVCKGSVYWIGNATGADAWVLVEITTDYLRLEDATRIRFIPTKSFPDIQWTQAKTLSSQEVLGNGVKPIDFAD